MIVNKEQLSPYLTADADLIPLHIWNKRTKDKKGKIQQRGKTPIYSKWTKVEKDTEKTLKLLEKGYNVGYRLGETDLVIDVDPRNYKDGTNSLKKLQKFLNIDDLAELCPTVITGSGGYHFYLTISSDVHLRETIDDYPGIEFKTKGRQVVAAGSKHPDGKFYEWDDLSPSLSERPKAPAKLVKLLKYDLPKKQAGAGVLTNEQLSRLLEQIPVEDYNDNDSWFKILCASHHGTAGLGIDEFLEWSLGDDKFADDEHVIRCRWQSMSEKPVSITVNTLYKEVLAHGGNTAVVTAEEDFSGLEDEELDDDELDDDFDDIVSSPEVKPSYKEGLATKLANNLNTAASEEDIVKAVRAALQAGTIEKVRAMSIIQTNLKWTKGQLNEVINEIKERIIDDLGRVLADKTFELKFFNKRGLVFNTNGQFWQYNGKYWYTVTKQFVGKRITEVLDDLRAKIDIPVKENTLVSESIGILERLSATDSDILRLKEKPYPVINCQNGELWIKDDGTVKLRKHRPKSYLLQLLDVEYSPGAECPIFDEAIRRTFSDFPDCEDIVRHFEEYMGYVLHPDKRPAKWWLFKGPGGDGKTTLMKILTALLGEAIIPESIERFSNGMKGDKHVLAELPGKLLVYDDDLNKNTLLPDGVLKRLSEDGTLTANPKGYTGFKFYKVCTVTMLSNGFPRTKDLTRGFRRRAAVIPFTKGFHENGAIIDLADQIIEKELAGVLNKAIEGLQRLRARGDFKEPTSCRLAREMWMSESNTVALFMKEKLDITEDAKDVLTLNDAYVSYTDWCHQHGIMKIDTKQQFRGTLEDMDVWYGKGAGNKAMFRGVKLLEDEIDDFDDLEDLD